MKVISRVNIIVIVLSHAFSNTPDASDTNIRNEPIRPHNITKSSKEFENKRPLFGHKIDSLERKINTLESTTSLINSLVFHVNPESVFVAKKFQGETKDDDMKRNIINYLAIIGILVSIVVVVLLGVVVLCQRTMFGRQPQREPDRQRREVLSELELKIMTPPRNNESASNRNRSSGTSNSGSSDMTSRLLSDFISPYVHKRTNNHNSGRRHSSKTKNIKKQRIRGSAEEHQFFTEESLRKREVSDHRKKSAIGKKSSRDNRLLSDFISPYGHKMTNNHNSGERHSSKTKDIKKQRIRGSAEEHKFLTKESLGKGEVSDLKRKSTSGKKSSRDSRLLSDFVSPYGHKRTDSNNSGERHISKTKDIKKKRIRGSAEEHQLLLIEESLRKGEVSDLKRKSTSGKKSSRENKRPHR